MENVRQPEFPALTNNEKRKEWLRTYRTWPVWFHVPQADETYYRYDLPDGSSIVICEYKMWLEWKERYADEDPDSIGRRFYLLKPGYHYLRDCLSSESILVEHIKEVQKRWKD